MLPKINNVFRLTREVELKSLPSSTVVANLGLVCSKKYKAQSGELKEETLFIDGVIFGNTANTANQYLKKGSRIQVEAELIFEQWQDQSGQKRSKHKLKIERFEMMDNKADNQGHNPPPQQNQSQQYQKQVQKGSGMSGYSPSPNPTYTREQHEQNIPVIDLNADDIPF